jgi:hypothetical protein
LSFVFCFLFEFIEEDTNQLQIRQKIGTFVQLTLLVFQETSSSHIVYQEKKPLPGSYQTGPENNVFCPKREEISNHFRAFHWESFTGFFSKKGE